MSYLEIKNLSISLGEFSLKDMSLTLEQGEYLTLLGPTGAGKTILLECIIGFYQPDNGRVILQGTDITDMAPEMRQIGIVYQDYALMPHMTIYDNIAYGLKKKNKFFESSIIHEMAETLNIRHLYKRKPQTLSGGEQQRVALARALVVKPKLLLMDEPFSALDPNTTIEAQQLLKEAVSRTGSTVMHITHDLNDSWALADKMAIVKSGRLQQIGPLNDVFSRPKSRFVADFVGTCLLEGSATGESQTVRLNGLDLGIADDCKLNGPVRVAIRPEHVCLSREKPANCIHRNIFKAQVRSMNRIGCHWLYTLDASGTEVSAMVMPGTAQELSARVGDELFAGISEKHIRICKHN